MQIDHIRWRADVYYPKFHATDLVHQGNFEFTQPENYSIYGFLYFLHFSRLVRQDNVKEEIRVNELRSPSKRTFAEAKQTLPEYDDMNQMTTYSEVMYSNRNTFLEADEDDTFETNAQQYQTNYYVASDLKLPYDEPEEKPMHHIVAGPNVHHVESYLKESLPEYNPPADENAWYARKERVQRRSSREFYENEMVAPSDDGYRRKPETMRSISEDTPTRTVKQAVTRRTLSHPEKESLSQVG